MNGHSTGAFPELVSPQRSGTDGHDTGALTMEHFADFADSTTAVLLYNFMVMLAFVVVGTIGGSLAAIFAIENLSGYVKDMKAWLARSKNLNGNGLA